MQIPFTLINWSQLPIEETQGETGMCTSQVLQFKGLRVRIVKYGAGYLADHWCQKGHVVHCLEGSFISEMEDGGFHEVGTGMTYIVSDHLSSHRSKTEHGATLLIVDGDFLKQDETETAG